MIVLFVNAAFCCQIFCRILLLLDLVGIIRIPLLYLLSLIYSVDRFFDVRNVNEWYWLDYLFLTTSIGWLLLLLITATAAAAAAHNFWSLYFVAACFLSYTPIFCGRTRR